MSGDLLSRSIQMKSVVKDPQHSKRVAMTIQSFSLNNNFCDVCFVCARGRKLFAHKLLLSSVSPQMKQMFLEPGVIYLDMIFIHLPDIEAQLLRRLLSFLYEGFARISSEEEFQDFKVLIKLLGISKIPEDNRQESEPAETEPEPAPQPTPPQIQQQQVYYLPAPATSNSQGQVQYIPVLAAQSPQMMSSTQQPMIINQSTGQMVQRVETPMQVQQMQVIQQNGPEQITPFLTSVPSSSHLQYTVAPQSNQPQYVSSCSTNEMMPARMTQATNRMRPTPQSTIQQTVRQNSAYKELVAEILGVLQNIKDQNIKDGGSVPVNQVCEQLEKTLNIPNHTRSQFAQILQEELGDPGVQPTPQPPPQPQTRLVSKRQNQKRKRSSPQRPPTDDEKDEDFDPVKEKKKRGRPRNKSAGLLKQ